MLNSNIIGDPNTILLLLQFLCLPAMDYVLAKELEDFETRYKHPRNEKAIDPLPKGVKVF